MQLGARGGIMEMKQPEPEPGPKPGKEPEPQVKDGTQSETRVEMKNPDRCRTRKVTQIQIPEGEVKTLRKISLYSKGDEDPWALPELLDTDVPWADLDTAGRVKRVTWYITRLLLLLGLLYMFICSLDILSSAFRLIGGKAAGQALSQTSVFNNPLAGLVVGLLSTVLVQSSSTSTSIIVSMVSSDLLPVHLAIFMVMGANIGTTVTNTIVALGQIPKRGHFRRAFGAATVHDMFNTLTVVILLPLEWVTGYLLYMTNAMTSGLVYDPNISKQPETLKIITGPFTQKILQLSSSKIKEIAKGKNVTGSLMKGDGHLFVGWTHGDTAAGTLLLTLSLLTLCVCLVLIVKLLSSILKGTIAKVLQRVVNSDLPGIFSCFTGYLAILVGAGLTILVQSSSVFTSVLTPLVGMGAIHIDRMYPLTLGSNIGTTVTGILAALASDPIGFKNSFQVALCHLFFNLTGIAIFFPVPFMRRVPIDLAKYLGDTVYNYRWFALVYLFGIFFLLPLLIFLLSLAGWQVFIGVMTPFILLGIFVAVVTVFQRKMPSVLPQKLRTWDVLPEPCRSLAPYDRLLLVVCDRCTFCHRFHLIRKISIFQFSEDTRLHAVEGASSALGEKGRGGVVAVWKVESVDFLQESGSPLKMEESDEYGVSADSTRGMCEELEENEEEKEASCELVWESSIEGLQLSSKHRKSTAV